VLSLLVTTFFWVDWSRTLTRRRTSSPSSQDGFLGHSSSLIVSQTPQTTLIVVITFLIQAAGGGLSTSTNISQAQTGGNIFLAGIAIQMASFALFSAMWILFIVRVYVIPPIRANDSYINDKALWNKPGWKSLYFALGFTCICFMIRSVFRTVELSQG
jgi:hypothetical protein